MSDKKDNNDEHGTDAKRPVDALVKLPPGVIRRTCPGCGYLITQTQVAMARFNFDCPHCGKHKLSEFQPIKAT